MTQKKRNIYTIAISCLIVLGSIFGAVFAIGSERGQYKEKIIANEQAIGSLEQQWLIIVRDMNKDIKGINANISEICQDLAAIKTRLKITDSD